MKKYLATAMASLLLLGSVCLWASEGVSDVIRLQKASVSEEILIAFVNNSSTAYDPNADEIEEMEKAGVSADVIAAMIDHGKELRASGQDKETAEASSSASNTPSNETSPSGVYENPSPGETPPVYKGEADVEVSAFYAPPSEDLNVSYFYGSLAPYGHWREIRGYGYCWQPEIVVTVSDWRPYSYGGHWENTDYGWYWVSDYPWGWATFHYGRWYQDPGYGWVWVPDTVWGPSWVTWRQSSDYYGWAPLPPEARFEAGVGFSFHNRHVGFDFHFGLNESAFEFVPARSFLSIDLASARIPRSRARTVYNNTTIVNNTYIYNDNRIINQGIPVSTVSTATGRRVDTVQVTDMSVATGQTFQRGEVRQGNRIAAFRPSIRSETPRDPATAAQRYRAEVRTRAATGRVSRQRSSDATGASQSSGATTTPSESQTRQRRDATPKSSAQQPVQQTDPSASSSQTQTQLQTKAQLEAQQRAEETKRRQEAQQRATEKAQRDAATRQQEEQSTDRANRAQQKIEEAKRDQEAQQRAATEKAQRDAATRQRQEQPAPRMDAPRERAQKQQPPKAQDTPRQAPPKSKGAPKNNQDEQEKDKDKKH